jgi:hypothetical protein
MTKAPFSKAKAKSPRSPSSGRFEAPSPLTDPALARYVNDTIAAVDLLLPTLLTLVNTEDSLKQRKGLLAAVQALAVVRETFFQALQVDAVPGAVDPAKVQLIVERAQQALLPVFGPALLPLPVMEGPQ